MMPGGFKHKSGLWLICGPVPTFGEGERTWRNGTPEVYLSIGFNVFWDCVINDDGFSIYRESRFRRGPQEALVSWASQGRASVFRSVGLRRLGPIAGGLAGDRFILAF